MFSIFNVLTLCVHSQPPEIECPTQRETTGALIGQLFVQLTGCLSRTNVCYPTGPIIIHQLIHKTNIMNL